jgi:GNAT superfamily N-acetyltransferase
MIKPLDLKDAVNTFARTPAEKAFIRFPFEFKRSHWIFEENGIILGRISANLSLKDPGRGYIGFFECDSEGASAETIAMELLNTAELWLKSQGVNRIYGPINYSTLFQYRFEIERDPPEVETPRFFWEPNQPLIYPEWFKQAGYKIADLYHSRAYQHLDQVIPKSQKRYDEACALGFGTRPFDLINHSARELRALSMINAGSFEESFLAEAFDEKAYRTLVVPALSQYLSEYSFFLTNPQGEEIGYFFLFPEHDYLIWKTLAVLPKYQGAGLASFGIHHALTLAHQNGIKKVVSALIRNGGQSEVLLKRGQEFQIWEHRYAVFEKTL